MTAEAATLAKIAIDQLEPLRALGITPTRAGETILLTGNHGSAAYVGIMGVLHAEDPPAYALDAFDAVSWGHVYPEGVTHP